MIKLLKAKTADSEQLVQVQKNAFSVDVELCGEGPPGYDSAERQIQLMESHIYYKIMDENTLIGGFYVYPKGSGHYELVRLFVEPAYQGKGIGSMVLECIEELFEDISVLELEASDFRKDNHNFYENRGFIKIGEKKYSEDSYSYVYQKRIKDCNKDTN